MSNIFDKMYKSSVISYHKAWHRSDNLKKNMIHLIHYVSALSADIRSERNGTSFFSEYRNRELQKLRSDAVQEIENHIDNMQHMDSMQHRDYGIDANHVKIIEK